METKDRSSRTPKARNSVSVAAIVPVYNVECYLEQCVESLLTQTYPLSKIILVDDGSTDTSGATCDSLAADHEVVSAVHKVNEGLGFARNTGLEILEGSADYVMFVDSDDWLEPNALERLLAATSGQNVDCVIGGHTKKDDDGNTQFVLQLENALYAGEAIRTELIPRLCGSAPECSDSIPMSACSSLYRVNYIQDNAIRFPSEREVISEDFVFKFAVLLRASRVVISDFTQYNYRTNVGSLTTSYRADRFEASVHFYCEILNILRAEGLPTECFTRLQKTFFIYLRMCIKQERRRISRKKFTEARRTISRELADPTLHEVLAHYPTRRLGRKQRFFLVLCRFQASGAMLGLAELGLL